MAKAAGSIPAGRTINGRESEWRGPRPITGWQKVRILPLPPTTRTKQNERHRQTLRMCDRSGERARLLIWWRASAHRGFESRHILQTPNYGPVTVAAERVGLLIRWLKPTAGSNPAWSSNTNCPVTPRVRRLDCLSSETGSSPVQGANTTGCSSVW